jgi:hypothetical protein
VLEHGRLASRNRDRQCLSGCRLELDDVGAVGLRAVDGDLVLLLLAHGRTYRASRNRASSI